MAWFVFLAVCLGIAVCLQGTVNGQLSGRIGLPLTLSINSGMVFVGALVWLALSHWITRSSAPRADASWVLYSGGVWGLVIISCAAVAYPRLGAGATTTIAVAAQVLTAIALDSFGLTGRTVALSSTRLFGIALVIAGTWLVVASSWRK